MENEKKLPHLGLPWIQGRFLRSRKTSMWSNEEIRKANDFENKRLFSSFTSRDMGKSRELVAEFRYKDDLEYFISVMKENTDLTAENAKLREACELAISTEERYRETEKYDECVYQSFIEHDVPKIKKALAEKGCA